MSNIHIFSPILFFLSISNAAGSPVAYDQKDWELVKSTTLALGDPNHPTSILLLRSRSPMGEGGNGSGGDSGILWLDIGGTAYGIQSDAVSFVETDPNSCNICPRFHTYDIYAWKAKADPTDDECFAYLGTINDEKAVDSPFDKPDFLASAVTKAHIIGRSRSCWISSP